MEANSVTVIQICLIRTLPGFRTNTLELWKTKERWKRSELQSKYCFSRTCRKFPWKFPYWNHNKPYNLPASTTTSGVPHDASRAVCQYADLGRMKPYLIVVTLSSPVVSNMSGRKMTDLFTFLLLASWESWIFFWVNPSVNFSGWILYGPLTCLPAPQAQIYSRRHNCDHFRWNIRVRLRLTGQLKIGLRKNLVGTTFIEFLFYCLFLFFKCFVFFYFLAHKVES